MSLFAELKRRNVFRVGIAYLVVAWLLLQVADVMIDNIGAPDWLFSSILLVLGVGFPLALVFAWAFEMTPEGLKRDHEVDRSQSITPVTGRRLDRAIIVVLTLALGYFVWDKATTTPMQSETAAAGANADAAGPDGELAEKSIAVLPFVNMSADQDNEYFSDGLSEELLNLLAKVDGLKVAARTSSFKFKGADADIAEIGGKLNVTTVLEGSVRKAGNQVRITAQLIKVDDGFHLWSETYDRELNNIFAVQDEIATAIVDALKLPLLGKDRAPASLEAINFEAYDPFLLGRHHERERNAAGFAKAIDYYTRAVELDPGYLPAWSHLAQAELGLADYGDKPLGEAFAQARKAIARAVAIDPDQLETLDAQAILYNYTGETAAELTARERMLEIDPDNVDALSSLTGDITVTDPERAERIARRSVALDPLSEVTRVRLIVVMSRHSGTETAVAQAQEFLRDEPDNPGFHEALGWVYFFAGDLEQSIANYAKAYSLRPGDVFPAWRNTEVYLRLDDPESARRWVEAAQQRGPGSQWAQAAQEVLDYFEGNLESFQFGPSGQPLSGRPGADRIQLLSQVLIRTGRHEDARQLLNAMLDWAGVSNGQLTSPLDANAAANLAYLLPAGPERDRVLAQLQAFAGLMLENLPEDWGSWQLKARLAAIEGQREEMLAALQKAIDLGLRGARMQSLDPVFSDFGNDPAYRELILRLERLSREARDRMAANPPPGLPT